MPTRSFVVAGALLMVGLGCRESDESPTEPLTYPPARVSAATALAFRQISAGTGLTCAVTTDNRAYCWGNNEVAPVAVVGGHSFKEVSVGFAHVCGVATDSRAYCWTHTIGDQPIPVPGELSFRQVSAGFDHTCGRTTENRVYCWGSNDWGELGDGTQEDQLAPVPVAGGRFYRDVMAAANWSCGVTTGYRAFCWGDDWNGQLGDSTGRPGEIRTVPVPVAGRRRFRQVDGGFAHTCGVTLDNRIYCWGANGEGQLGIGRFGGKRRWPCCRVLSPFTFDRVSTGSLYTCAETTENRAHCWGLNSNGQLGDGTKTWRSKPVAVARGLLFKQLTADGFPGFSEGHTCGTTTALRAYCWGFNSLGELGDGTTIDRPRPTSVIGPM
jgi:alpha-tubulin suppressor-like RCC1 family protein